MTIKSMSLHEFYNIDADKFAEDLEQLVSLEHLDAAEKLQKAADYIRLLNMTSDSYHQLYYRFSKAIAERDNIEYDGVPNWILWQKLGISDEMEKWSNNE